MQLPTIKIVNGIRVLSTKQIAEAYEAKEVQIYQNFKNNRSRFIDGKHYISLTGDNLKEFKNHPENFEVVDRRASHLYFWTEKGALLHAKSLNTDKAWEVYDYLVDHYFRAQGIKQERSLSVRPMIPEVPTQPPAPKVKPPRLVVDVPDNVKIQHTLKKIEKMASAIETLTGSCSRYLEEETYRALVTGIYNLGVDLLVSISDLRQSKPNLIEK